MLDLPAPASGLPHLRLPGLSRRRADRTDDRRLTAGLTIGRKHDAGAGNDLIAQQARRWDFSHPTQADQIEHDAVRTAAAFIDEHPDLLPGGAPPPNRTQLAVLAIEIHHVFLRHDDNTGRTTLVVPDAAVVRGEVMRQMAAGIKARGRPPPAPPAQ